MRVLHLYAGNLYGGVETFLTTLVRHRALAGMQHAFGLSFEGRLSRELRELGAPVEMLGEVRFSRPWSVWAARRKLRDLFERESFDVVVCHSPWPHAVFAIEAKRVGVPLVYWAHNPPEKHWLEWLASHTPPDLVVANSTFTLSEHNPLFGGCKKVVLRYPVSASKVDRKSARHKLRDELRTNKTDVVIVCSSRLESWKGHRMLIEALAMIKDVAGWTTWIAGGVQRDSERTYLAELKQQALRSGLESRVQFIGQRSDIPSVLAAADIHCQPNTGGEPFGIAFVEAMYAGLPVVTTRLGAAPEVIGRECGILVEPAASALADALRMLIENAAERSRLGVSGPECARALCDPSVTMPAFEIALRNLIDRTDRT